MWSSREPRLKTLCSPLITAFCHFSLNSASTLTFLLMKSAFWIKSINILLLFRSTQSVTEWLKETNYKVTLNFIFGKLHISDLTSKLLPSITKCKQLAPPPPSPPLRFDPITFTEFPLSLFTNKLPKSYATEKLALLKKSVVFFFS